MKIATWNVNSIRARLHIVPQWLKDNDVDVLCMQEIKCMDDQFPYEAFEEMGYNCYVHGQKALNGVAIVSRYPMEDIKTGLPQYEFQDPYNEARYIEGLLDLDGGQGVCRISSIYVPNGNPLAGYDGDPVASPRFLYKLDFFRRLIRYMEEQKQACKGEIILHTGDFNVMHQDIDIYNSKNWIGEIGFLPEERDMLDDILNLGFLDTFRDSNPDSKEFSWWDYRHGSFQKGYGLRIDYMYVLNLIENSQIKTLEPKIDKSARALEKTSDHAPCSLLFK